MIHPCKACVSTSMALCHWPCSCYPNHAMGQTNDWMAELYPRWVAAHGVLVVCPVHWYQAPASLKLMIDRLVCADGGNPDPDHDARQGPGEGEGARARGLAVPAPSRRPRVRGGRARRFAGPRGSAAQPRAVAHRHRHEPGRRLGRLRYAIGYYEPYATSHDKLDASPEIFVEVENAARSLVAKGARHSLRAIPRAGRGAAASATKMTARAPLSGNRIAPVAMEDAVRAGASGLERLGVRQGDVVCILLHNSPAFLEAQLAARLLGAYWCPINWHYKADEAGWILRDSGAKALITDAALRTQTAAGIPSELPVVDRLDRVRREAGRLGGRAAQSPAR